MTLNKSISLIIKIIIKLMSQNTSLFLQFKGFDNDGDGKLTVDEAY
jgi:Ca2+-binding EF-hand superfamily protein